MNKRAIFTYVIGIVLIASSLFYISYAATKVNDLIPRDTVIIAPVRHDASFMFDSENAEKWANSYDGFVATENVSIQVLANQASMGFVQMSAVSNDYFRIMQLPFVSGSPQLMVDGRGIVLCMNMAWALFGSVDVVGLMVQIAGVDYSVAGVVESVAGNVVNTDGFAWITGDVSGVAGIIYVSPANYIPLSARLDTERLLSYLNLQADLFSITDGNSYVDSIALRGQFLLALIMPGFLIVGAIWVIRLYRLAKGKLGYVVAGLFSVLLTSVIAYFIWSMASIDLWLPAYVGEGLSGYSQLVFNTGLLTSRIYLPMHLAAVYDLNFNANIAFGVGVFGLLVVGITKFLTRKV